MTSRKITAAAVAAAALTLPAAFGVPPALASTARLSHASGLVASIGGPYFTIKRPGHASGVLAAMTRAANRITAGDYPYVWGGGHGQAGVPSVGIRGGPGFNGRRKGFDCSGSVAAVLVAGGLWPQGGGVPSDAGVIHELKAQHLLARGAGSGPRAVTLYDDPGVHIFMNIDGRFFGTSDGAGGGDRKGGPGWLNDSAWDVHNRRFKRWHFPASVLRAKTTAGLLLTFATGENWTLLNGLVTGDSVSVAYRTSKLGTMLAKAVKLCGESTISGTLQSVGKSTLTLSLSGGKTREFALLSTVDTYGLVLGDTLSVAYTTGRADGATIYDARSVTVTGTAGSGGNGGSGTGPGGDGGAAGSGNYPWSAASGGSGVAPNPPDGGVGVG